MLGVSYHNTQARVYQIYHILLFTKFYIYRQKSFYEGNWELTTFLRELQTKLTVERYICSREGKGSNFKVLGSILTAFGLIMTVLMIEGKEGR